MKRIVKWFMLLMIALLVCGCAKDRQEIEIQKKEYDIAGKTFYCEADGNVKVWFGKDGSFVFSGKEGASGFELSGSWLLKEDVVTLSVPQEEKILFEVESADQMVLKTGVRNVKGGQSFSLKKPETINAETGPDVSIEEDISGIYYNLNQPGNARSYVELKKDGSVVIAEVSAFAIMEASGSYVKEGNLITVSDLDPAEAFGKMNDKIFYFFEEKGKIRLDNDLGVSMKGDPFVFAEYLPDDGPMGDSLGNYHSKWQYTMDPALNEAYMPSVEFTSAGEFIFIENLYAGMGEYRGWYEKRDDGFTCHVDTCSFSGYAGDDVKTIEFRYKDASTLILDSDLCMCRKGDLFALMP